MCSSDLQVSAGNDAYDAERYDEALDAYRRAGEMAPDDAAITYDIGTTLHRLRRFEEAASASAAAAAQTDDATLLQRATYAVGSHAFRRDALEEAREAFISVLLRDPDDDDARHNLELVLQALAPPPADEPAPAVADGDQGEGEQEQDSVGDLEDEQEERERDRAPGELESDSPADSGSTGGGDPGAPGDATTLEEAQQALEGALTDSDQELTLEEALQILDLVRQVNAFASLEPSLPDSGPLPSR